MDSNGITYHNSPRRLLSQILLEERSATRIELEVLFMRHVVGSEIKAHCIAYFRDLELQRMLCLELYRANVLVKEKDRGCVIQQLTDSLGVHLKTVERWIREEFNGKMEN